MLWTSINLLGPTLSIYKLWNNMLLQLLTDVQKCKWNKEKTDPKYLFLKTFFHFRLLCLIAGNSFFQSTGFFFSLVAAIHLSVDTVFFRRALAAINCLYIMYLTYFYLRRTVISNEHLQPYIWVVPSLLQEALLQWPSIFQGTVFLWNKHWQLSLIRNSSRSHPFDEEQNKRAIQPNFLSNLLYFCRTGIGARRYHSY